MPDAARDHEASALFVRLPAEQARRLDRAAAALPAHKKDVIAGLLERYVDPDDTDSLDALRALTGSRSTIPHRVIVEGGQQPLTVGHHAFRPTSSPDVLDLDEVAELLGVKAEAVLALATDGELPGRSIEGQWRFNRQAVLDWLAHPS